MIRMIQSGSATGILIWKNYEMCVPLFGRTSSTGCFDYDYKEQL